ncbi:transporter substrate-binding domain-containing protein [Alkalimonas sp. MEB108]|uniref:Transporter substrate-binding domain-containing protein n=1 Tax=Alkalimonas cellulosilytica TaxID=3058395 RepID=A0ABU7J0E1_9GAMM|nr:transporter substrate-binding domain-containing protein [Alkalimonas sp. MEB108]MEE1999964.1 transporter substrate-binding domain-containing protein [Alkalimonas sp. MEB108]
MPVLQLLTEHSPPGEYLDEDGQLAGVTYELLKNLATELDEPVQFELMPWARAYTIATSQPLTALFETTRTPAREPLFQWVGPLKIHRIALYARKDRFNLAVPPAYWPKHYIACEYIQSVYLDKLNELGFNEERNLFKTVQHGDCFNLLARGRVDIILLSETSAALRTQEVAELGIELVPLNGFIETRQYLAFSRDVPVERVARWQQALLQSYRDGRMRALYQSVYPEEMITALEQEATKPHEVAK